MNEPGDIPLTHNNSTPDSRPPCSIISIIPNIGMSSCRGRAEAFARSLSSKLRTLGSQANEEGADAEDEPIINGTNTNTWVNAHESEQTVTDLQPLRHESDSFFDFDCELESPGSPVDECEYLRLIETASNTPHNSTAESGYACASVASSHSSTDGPYFDAAAGSSSSISNPTDELLVTIQSKTQPNKLPTPEHKEYMNALQLNGTHVLLTNGVEEQHQEEEEEEGKVEKIKEQELKQAEISNQIEDEKLLQAQILSELLRHSDSFKGIDNKLSQELPEQERLEQERLEEEQVQQERVQQERLEEEQMQQERVQQERVQQERVQQERVQQKRVQQERERELLEQELLKQVTVEVPALVNGHAEQPEDQLLQLADKTVAPTTDLEEQVAESGIDEVDKCTENNLTVNVELAQIEQAKLDAAAAVSNQEKSGLSHAIDTTDDEDDCRPQRVRRCSSLKTGKTPPGTPGRKKIVRFADVLGLDLADVKTFLDEIPTIPKSAFEDLEILESEPPMQLGPKSDKMLMPLFQQPGGLPTFLDAVREKQVSLENAAVTDSINQTITGSVRVRNLDFHKSVHMRYSLDGWRSYADLQANYVENSCDGFSDKFTFVLFGNSLHVGQRLEFAVRFQCKGQQFWDNNYGANYCFQCLPSSTHTASPASVATSAVPTHHTPNLVGMLSPTAGEAWCSSFY